MPAPLLFIGLPILLAPVVYVLYRARVVAIGLAAAAVFVLAVLALALPFGQPLAWAGGLTVTDTLTVLGRAFTVEGGDRLALAFVLAQAALLFLISGLGEANPTFLPVGLVNLGLLAAALFVRPFLFSALFLELGAAASVVMLAATSTVDPYNQAATRGALRYLVFTTLSLPFILLTGWLLDAAQANPGDSAFTTQATVLLMAGFAVLLAVVPFHSWVPALAEHSPPFAAAFVFSVMRQGVIFLLLSFLGTYPWLNQNPVVYRALTLAGGGMALAGGLLAFGQRNFGRTLGYAVLVDVGAVMLAIGLGTPVGVQAALATLAVRGLALPMWAAGVDRLRRAAGGDDFDAIRGLGRRYPIATIAAVLGLLSIAGFPLTAGFPPRWALLYQLAQIHPTAAIFLLVGMVSLALVGARGLAALLAPMPSVPNAQTANQPEPLGPRAIAAYGLGFAVIFVLGLFPQWILPAVAGTADALSRVTP
jgi:formate hydrogenlyase subunit 3/multisubunit Na+/H+ antiporter MnhD subunit